MAFATARLSPLLSAARERLPPPTLGPRHIHPRVDPPEASPVEGGFCHSTHPRTTARGPFGGSAGGCGALHSISTRPGRVVFLSRAPSVDPHLTTERRMARGDVRIAVTLACEECKRRNYQTNKSKRNNPDRITLRKYCKWCRSHTSHRETR